MWFCWSVTYIQLRDSFGGSIVVFGRAHHDLQEQIQLLHPHEHAAGLLVSVEEFTRVIHTLDVHLWG